jgi:acetyl-CoA carboxylase carboxyl transferase beta subunit/acetyl-CoA carboxylase carboxyl transferase alpha subunit
MTALLTAPPRASTRWRLCPGCRAMLYVRRLERNLLVCPSCGRHEQVSAPRRLDQLLDQEWTALYGPAVAEADRLRFTDTQPYSRRLSEARQRTGLEEAVVCARGKVDGQPVIAAVMDFRFMGGSLGASVGERITQAAEAALAERTPLLIVTASGGARMQEGAIALMQMAKTAQALAQLDEAGILTIALVTDPTFGGVAASFATLCDIIVAEPGARLGFAGPRVIQQTIRGSLPPGFQTAEFLLERGFVDAVQARHELRSTIGKLLRTFCDPGVCAAQPAPPAPSGQVLVTDTAALPERDPWETVRRARDIARPTMLDYICALCADFVELHGDRVGGDCRAIIAGPARLRGIPVMLIGHQKGHSAAELADRNFGMPAPAGYRKAGRMMRLAGKLMLPVVTLIDTPGAYPGAVAEEQGQAVAIAENLRLMAGLRTPVVAVVTGEGGSGGALALAVADTVLCHADSFYSVISPEGCAAILWKDAAAAPKAAAALRLDARSLLELGVVDAVIAEPPLGVAAEPGIAADNLGEAVGAELIRLRSLPAWQLTASRRERFRRYGTSDDPRRVNC